MREPETTARIRREDLKDLLETEAKTQRITARMPAVTLTNLLTLKDDDLPPIPPRVRPAGTRRMPTVQETAVEHEPAPWNLDQWPSPFVIALSCAGTLLLISLLLRVL